jgi:hypothetical protein
VRYLFCPGGAFPAGFRFGADTGGGAGADAEAGGAGAGGGNEAGDSCSEPLKFDDRRVGTGARAVVRGIATGLEARTGERSASAGALGEGVVVLGEGVVVLGEDGGVVLLGGSCARVAARWPPRTPDEAENTPAKTRIVNAAAATTAAPMTPAPTTKAPRIAARLSLCRDAGSSALDCRRPSAYPAEACPSAPPRGSAKGSVRTKKSSSRGVTFQSFEPPSHRRPPTPARRSDPRT